MAENDENSMIGYDPLAWLHENTKSEFITDVDNLENKVAKADENQLKNANTLPKDLFVATDNMSSVIPEYDCSGESNEVEFHSVTQECVVDLALTSSDDTEYSESVDDLLDTVDSSITLEATQNIQNVGLLHQRLQRALDIQEKLDIDASAVTQIDTATLQLLLVLKLTAVKLRKEVNIDFPSQKFIDAAYLLGLAEMLSVDQTASGLF